MYHLFQIFLYGNAALLYDVYTQVSCVFNITKNITFWYFLKFVVEGHLLSLGVPELYL